MDLSARNLVRAAVVALAVGLCVNVYGLTGDIIAFQVIGMVAIFVALLV